MPRIPPSLFRKAYTLSPNLLPLLRTCRDLESASNELRWLREHVAAQPRHGAITVETQLRNLCVDRGCGKPLQYILGTEFFGDLELLCRPGVLIPRQETARSVSYLVERLHRGSASHTSHLRVLDLCTGSGCMALLFHHEYTKANKQCSNKTPTILGIDISPRAKALAETNFAHVYSNASTSAEQPDINFALADILSQDDTTNPGSSTAPALPDLLHQRRKKDWDIIISNPPYISPSSFLKDTSPSVRKFEPKLALVPPSPKQKETSDEAQGDLFYPAILRAAEQVHAKVLLLEVADLDQAKRVAGMAVRGGWDGVEIWRDEPGWRALKGEPAPDEERAVVYDKEVEIKGFGHGRSVFCWRGEAASWLCASRK